MTAVWQRARSDAQKEQRRTALLDAAARMLASRPLDEISLNGIAREANISKANVYRYFESREELFLRLFSDAFDDWRAALLRRLARLGGSGDAEAYAAAVSEVTAEHDTFAHLASVLATVLERNISTEVVADFKLASMAGFSELMVATRDVLPDLSLEDTTDVMQIVYFQLVGLWPASHPAPAVQAALERPELASLCVQFEPSLRRATVIAVEGVRARSRASTDKATSDD